jgi:hypothetical protein
VGLLVAAAVVLGPLDPADSSPLPHVVDVHQPAAAQP